MKTANKSVIIGVYILAAIIGLLFVLYHLFAIWYSNLSSGAPTSISSIILALANLIYPISIFVLLTVRTLRPLIYKPAVFLAVILLVPIIFALNWVLVATLLPYTYNS